jgi:hypothetical protein
VYDTDTDNPDGAEVGVTTPAATLQVAEPATNATPRQEVPTGENVKFTDPAGVPVPGPMAWTVAVNVRAWPETDGLADEVMTTRLLAGFTAGTETMAEVLVVKLLSPEYAAWMAGRTAAIPTTTLHVAVVPTRATVPQAAGLPGPAVSVNVTVPVAVPAAGATGATVAVKVTF